MALNIITALLLLCLNSSLSAATLVFDINAQRSIASYDGGLQWTATGSYSFQISIDLDQNQYSFSDTIPEPYQGMADYYHQATVAIDSFSGDSFDEIEGFKQGTNISDNAVTSSGGLFEQSESIGLGLNLKELGFRSSVHDEETIGDSYISEISGGHLAVQSNVYNENFAINYQLSDLLENTSVITYNDFISLLSSQKNIVGAFDFNHTATDFLDECLIEVGMCYSGVFGEPMFGGSGIKYDGSATLVSISSVPVPAAAWLLGSALIGLAGIKRKK